jgi:hypothetical protein
VLGRGVIGQHNAPDIHEQLFDGGEHLDAAAVGKMDVEDRHVGAGSHDAGDGRVAGPGFSHHLHILDLADHLDQPLAHGRRVFHHKDLHVVVS